ncbi:haloacid dehalogenase [Allgaiera indica]|uniref:Haloacid dehalogenase n=1 Tax=Allgaiera indica TaxID=765699 RepID=A0AAN5A065_9RHOB|nr:HD domain-containing protein [Allgaiera indica]GHE03432.1 haloacid dehalogenase [Allgaiera indica]SDX25692.1 putative hydrolases of HD superfamily [Allgaiera indica]
MTDQPPGPARLSAPEAESIVAVLSLAERLKREMRHSWLSDGRRESVAEHTWLMSIAAILVAPRLERPVDLGHTLKLIALHDIAEAITGDIPCMEQSPRKDAKQQEEARAMETIKAMLPADIGAQVITLWREYEDAETDEARLARALDKLEVQHQHNLADLATWTEPEYGLVYTKMDRECAHDATLGAILSVIRGHSERKLEQGGVDVRALRDRHVRRD